ncbi:MAG: two-component system nitrate/nitrite response regulator NarL [Crocinitomix sp.]|jgi:two-component system nitrate/nitrite response regulator NarL
MIKILLADDHGMILDGLKSILKNETDIKVVGTADNGEDAVHIIENNDVDVAILDINMPKMNGIEATRIIRANSDTKVLILSMHDTYEFIDELIDAGCQGYILKNKGQEELVTAIRRVHNGKPYFGERIKERIMEERLSPKKNKIAMPVSLTKREIEVLKLIAQEFTSPEIAEKLFIVEATVNTHRRNLISKLGVRNSLGLVSYAYKNGMIE